MSNMVTATYSGESAKQVFDPNNNSYPKPYIIATSGVPLIVIGSGTVNSSGEFTLTTALPTTPQGIVNVYIYAGVGLAAGLYPATFTSTTQCQLVGFPATTAGAYAGGTTAVSLATIKIPGGTLGPNGKFRVEIIYTGTTNANQKNVSILYAGSSILSSIFWSTYTAITARLFAEFFNKGFESVNAHIPSLAYGQVSLAPAYTSIDTSKTQNLTFNCNVATATDSIMIEHYVVTVYPSV